MLFVTGMPRSGTTLIEKLLSHHPAISLLSQPFPFLFLDAKRTFLDTFGRGGDPYPLGDLFMEADYALDDFTRHLWARRIEPETVRAVFAAMDGYSGQSTKFQPRTVEEVTTGLQPDNLAGTMARLYAGLSRNSLARHVGSKEIACEEFLPYLLAQGARCLLIVRDPRDILASLNHGRGTEFAGAAKPTLFNLRQWRKSVAFLIHLRHHPGFVGLRYEDLVADPLISLNRLAAWLGVEPFDEGAFEEGVRSHDGTRWQGNSSHAMQRGLDASSVGRYSTVLPAVAARYAEAACYPELRYLCYDVSLSWDEVPSVIAGFVEPYAPVRENLREKFSDPHRINEELERIRLLSTSEAADRYFLFGDVQAELKKAIAP